MLAQLAHPLSNQLVISTLNTSQISPSMSASCGPATSITQLPCSAFAGIKSGENGQRGAGSILETIDLDFVRELVRKRSAIVLDKEKSYLVESRLLPLARREGLASIEELVAKLRLSGSSALQTKVVEAMTTNETSFFRDLLPFEALRKGVLTELIKKRASSRQIRIWCAASSSGQEPYSIAMLIKEHFPQLASWDVKIMATEALSMPSGACYDPASQQAGQPGRPQAGQARDRSAGVAATSAASRADPRTAARSAAPQRISLFEPLEPCSPCQTSIRCYIKMSGKFPWRCSACSISRRCWSRPSATNSMSAPCSTSTTSSASAARASAPT